jgi:predicted dinucleotide-utilizing enzyme
MSNVIMKTRPLLNYLSTESGEHLRNSLTERTFGRIAESIQDDETLVAIAEYEALRQEIVQRLQAQQSLINYSVLVGSLPVPIV